MVPDTLLDLHSKLSTVVRYYDRMLEERLSSAYSQQTFAYGAVPGASQYPNMGLPAHTPDAKFGAENFYYGNPPDTSRPPTPVYAPHQVSSNGYARPPSDLASPVYPPQAQHPPRANEPHNNAWSQSPYPTLGSPPPSNSAAPSHIAPGPGGPAQYYASRPDQDPARPQFPGAPYQPSPAMQRDSQYQANAPPSAPPPSAPEPHSPGHVQSPSYSTVAATGAAQYQQPNGPPPQPYYYQPQQPSTAPAAYPQMTTGQPGAYPEAAKPQPPASQPGRPVEESLIEL